MRQGWIIEVVNYTMKNRVLRIHHRYDTMKKSSRTNSQDDDTIRPQNETLTVMPHVDVPSTALMTKLRKQLQGSKLDSLLAQLAISA